MLRGLGGGLSAVHVTPVRSFRLAGFQPAAAVAPDRPTTISFTVQQPSVKPLTRTGRTGTAHRRASDHRPGRPRLHHHQHPRSASMGVAPDGHLARTGPLSRAGRRASQVPGAIRTSSCLDRQRHGRLPPRAAAAVPARSACSLPWAECRCRSRQSPRGNDRLKRLAGRDLQRVVRALRLAHATELAGRPRSLRCRASSSPSAVGRPSGGRGSDVADRRPTV